MQQAWVLLTQFPAMAPAELFSATLPPFEGQLPNPALQDSVTDLQHYLGGEALPLLAWDAEHVAIALAIPVELPPLGNYEELDIRELEPVLFVLSLADYPTQPPTVHTDRLDFPKDRLAHLYIACRNRPPAFCLVRGSFKEWYANKRLRDVVVRTGNWLRDAAVGGLTLDGEQYDPLRLEGYRGTVIYPYDKLAAAIRAGEAWGTKQNFTLLLFENTSREAEKPAFRFEKFITPSEYLATRQQYVQATLELLANKTLKVKQYHLGYLLWATDSKTYSQYSVDLPQNWVDFQAFCTTYGIKLDDFEQFIADEHLDFNIFPAIPVICALRRPKPVIGFSSDIEFVNFYLEVTSADKQNGSIVSNLPVHFQAHNEPLTWRQARAISGSFPHLPDGTFVVGCGALGSKVVMHLARNGVNSLFLLDPDEVSPHNLVRYALHAEAEGMYKAVALASTINKLFRHEATISAFGLPKAGEFIWKSIEQIQLTKQILDFSASEAFLTSLVNQPHLEHTAITRAILSDQGNLGVLSVEGPARNPRLDDLQVALYAHGKHSPAVVAWLQREQTAAANEGTLVTVGVGCNSETTILADEVISLHAAYFAQVIKYDSNRSERSGEGQVFLSRVASGQDLPGITTERLLVPKRVVMTAGNDPTWTIRMCPAVAKAIRAALRNAYPNETGGVLIGQVNYKTKTVHVVDLVLAPADSQATPVCFFRGIQGLPEAIDRASHQSGGQLGYVGEWHTHPLGPNGMSTTDHNTVQRFKREFDELPNPLPVFLLIATSRKLLPFVY